MAINNKIDIMAGGYDPRMRPPPGHSLTTSPGNAKYEKPPRYSTSEEFINFSMERLSVPDVEEELMDALATGISIQEVVNGLAITAFSEGLANPDVVENSKPELFVNVLSRAMDFFDVKENDDLPFKLFPTESGVIETAPVMSDSERLATARELNPVAAEAYEKNRERASLERDKEAITDMAMELEKYRSENRKQQPSFLNVKEV